jgi:hypothetical protein
MWLPLYLVKLLIQGPRRIIYLHGNTVQFARVGAAARASTQRANGRAGLSD